MPKEVFVGTLVFPILILAFAGLFAAVNKARLTLDRWKGSEDGVDWPVETPIESFWIQRQAIGFGWRILFISTFYIYSSGFGWVGGALRRSFVPWKHVRNIEHRTFSGVIEYTRAGNDRHLKLASVKPILDAWELAKQPGSRKRI
ncbi:MAG: hypothetical protein R3E76_00785 [Planctomycetota bacterium]